MTLPTAAATGSTALLADGRLRSDLWLDQPDALERIEERRRAGELEAEQAANLRHFVERGYLVFRPRLEPELFERIDQDVERLWREQPSWVAYAYHSRLTRFSAGTVDDRDKRRPSCRIADLHTFSLAALDLYLHPEIHDYVGWIFGEPAIATQSLYFEWGSGQALHRDPMHVQMPRPANLLAAWVALEDVGPECGPLVYVPGSHRLPYYQFEPGRFVHDHAKDGQAGVERAEAWDAEHCERAGLRPEPFTCRRGDVLIWHHSLLHGGAPVRDGRLTRKSFVVHLTTRADMTRQSNFYLDPHAVPPDAPPLERVLSTERVLERGKARGFESPLAAHAAGEAVGLYGRVHQQERELEELRSRIGWLENRITAMEQSRFWKLRNRWFALKRGLGLTSER